MGRERINPKTLIAVSAVGITAGVIILALIIDQLGSLMYYSNLTTTSSVGVGSGVFAAQRIEYMTVIVSSSGLIALSAVLMALSIGRTRREGRRKKRV